LIHNLDLPELQNKTFIEAVRELETESNKYLRLKIVTKEFNQENSFPLTKKETSELFFIVKEALQNSIKYSETRHFNIQLYWGNGLELVLEDHGYGIKPGAKAGLGMMSMQSRAKSIGATFDFVSGTADGLSIVVKLEPKSE
jgi:signal transduction histidine kinase